MVRHARRGRRERTSLSSQTQTATVRGTMAFTVPRRWCIFFTLTSYVSLGHVPYHRDASWTSYDFHTYPHPQRKPALPRDIMVDVINNLGLKLLAIHNEYNENNIAISPYGVLSVLIALGEGVQGNAVIEIQQCAKLPNDISVIRVGLRDIHRHLKSYFIPKEGFLAGLTLNHDNVTLRAEYQDILKFYGFDIFTFNNGLYPEPETTEQPSLKTTTTSVASSKTMPTTSTTEVPTTNDISKTIETTTTVTDTDTITTGTESTTLVLESVEPKFYSTPSSQDITVSDLSTTTNSKLSNPMSIKTAVLSVTQYPITQETTRSQTVLTTELLETRTVPNSFAETEMTTRAVEEEATTIQKTTTEIPTETTTETIQGTTTEEAITEKSTGKPSVIPGMVSSFVTTTITTKIPTEIPTTTNVPIIETTINSQTSEDIQTTDNLHTISGIQTTEIDEVPQTTVDLPTTENSQTTETIQTPDNSQFIRSINKSSKIIESLQSTNNSQTVNITQIPDNLQSTRRVETTESLQTIKNIQDATKPSTRKENLVAMVVTESENNDTSTNAVTVVTYPYPGNGFAKKQLENEIIPGNNHGVLEKLNRDPRSQRLKIEKDLVELNVFHKNDHRNHRRKTRSLVDYIIAKYYDNLHFSPHNERSYVPEEQLGFLINGKFREYQINFMKYDAVLPFYYVSHLNAAALSFPLDNVNYYLLLILPVDENGLDQLICDIRLNESIKYIIDNLRYKHVIATIPSFQLKGYVNLTPSIQKLGIQRIFEPRQADFSPMTDHRNVYVTNIEQAITVNIRNYMDPNVLEGSRNLRQFEPLEFKADHPFLYFVLDSELHVTLMAGKIINPLNARIR